MNRMRALCVLAVLVLAPAPRAHAQLLAAKDGPIVYGHHHLAVSDVAAHKKFWVDTLGGVAVTIGTQNREIVKFPNALLFMNPGMPSGGSRGSTVNHIGFSAPDLKPLVAKITAVKVGSTVVIDALGDSILDLLVLEIRLVPPIAATKRP